MVKDYLGQLDYQLFSKTTHQRKLLKKKVFGTWKKIEGSKVPKAMMKGVISVELTLQSR